MRIESRTGRDRRAHQDDGRRERRHGVDLERHRQAARRVEPGPDAPEAKEGFLLNHVIDELLPEAPDGHRYANSDPVTGQAAWYDLRVRLTKIDAPRKRRRPAPRVPR